MSGSAARAHGRVRVLTGGLVLAALVLAAGCAPGSEEPEHRRIAFLRAVAGAGNTETAVIEELRNIGYTKDRNLTVLGESPDEAYPDPADAEQALRGWLEEGPLDLIVALSTGGATLARDVAPEANIVFLVNDPKAVGLVEDEFEPEGRLTGATFRVPTDRTLDLARRAVPGLASIGLAYPAGDPAAEAHRVGVEQVAGDLGVALVQASFEDASTAGEAVARLAEQGADALLLSTSPAAIRVLPQIGEAAQRHRLPTISNTHLADFALIALYPDYDELGRQLGRQVARLLTGTTASAIPVEDPRRFQIDINLGVAASLNIEIPGDLQREANRVID